MSRIVFVSPTTEFEKRLDSVLGSDDEPRQRWQEQYLRVDPTKVVDACAGGDVEVVCLGPDLAPETALSMASAFDRERPELCVVLLAEPTAALWEGALHAGVREVVSADADDQTLGAAFSRATDLTRRRQATLARAEAQALAVDTSRVITVLSPKGGTGKTTIASNLAVGLGRAHPGHVVLVDLDVQFGDVVSVLGLTPEHTLSDLAKAPSNLDATMLKVFLTPHDSGIYVLCAPDTPADADDVTAAHAATLIGLLRSEFDFVVIDTGAGLDEHCLAAIEASTDLVFVSSTDVAGVRNVRKEIDVLDRLDFTSADRHLVLNRADAKVGLDPNDIEGFVGMPIDVCLPSSRLVPLSNNEGAPILGDQPKSPISRSLAELVGRFFEHEEPEPGQTGRRAWRHKKAS